MRALVTVKKRGGSRQLGNFFHDHDVSNVFSVAQRFTIFTIAQYRSESGSRYHGMVEECYTPQYGC